MSRKTSEIKKSLEKLNQVIQQLYKNCDELPQELCRKNKILLEEMEQELNSVDSWFSMLYQYNGKSRTNLKVAASRENGKKGGRPPKIVTELKRKKQEKEEELQEIHRKKLATFDPEEENSFTEQENLIAQEIEELQDQIEKILVIKMQKEIV